MDALSEHRRAVRVVIRGRVQGVGFRAWAQGQAELHGLAGWVRNRRDGSVEMLLSGPEAAIASTVAACRQGPRGARVDGVEEHAATPAEADKAGQGGFRLLPTA